MRHEIEPTSETSVDNMPDPLSIPPLPSGLTGFPKEIVRLIWSFLALETLLNSQQVGKTWYVWNQEKIDDHWKNKEFNRLSSGHCWQYLLKQNFVETDDPYTAFLYQALNPLGLYTEDMNIDSLSQWYQTTIAVDTFVSEITQLHPIVPQKKVTGTTTLKTIVEKFHNEITPQKFQKEATALKQDASSLAYPRTDIERTNTKKPSVVLLAFLTRLRKFEVFLLDLTLFRRMLYNPIPLIHPEIIEKTDDASILTNELAASLSKEFILYYTKYIDCKGRYPYRVLNQLLLSNPALSFLLFKDDDQLLETMTQGLWNELPAILEKNLLLFEIITPEFW